MRIVVTGDHAGYVLKSIIVDDLKKCGHEVTDLGTHEPNQPDDYPDFAELACEAIRRGEAERGVIICGSGVGVTVAANKFPGIRAGLCHDYYSAHQGVEHDHMNVLVLGGRVIGEALAHELVGAFVGAKQSQEERHLLRLAKIEAIEAKCGRQSLNGPSGGN